MFIAVRDASVNRCIIATSYEAILALLTLTGPEMVKADTISGTARESHRRKPKLVAGTTSQELSFLCPKQSPRSGSENSGGGWVMIPICV